MELTVGIIAAVFFVVFAAIAVFAFFIVRRTVKMAMRMLIVAAIFLIAIVGSLALWFGVGKAPATARPRATSNSTR